MPIFKNLLSELTYVKEFKISKMAAILALRLFLKPESVLQIGSLKTISNAIPYILSFWSML